METHWWDIARIAIDFGLVILIWMTHLIVYPSFLHMTEDALKVWHIKYTAAITIFVAPLMFLQASVVAAQLIFNPNVWQLIAIILLVIVWWLTFFRAVPLHSRIDKEAETRAIRQKLLKVNYPRAIIWTVVFLLGLIALL